MTICCKPYRTQARETARQFLPGLFAWVVSGATVLAAVAVAPAFGQSTDTLPPQFEGIGLDQRIGAEPSRDLVFRNEDGDEVALGQYFDGKRPVLLTLVYHECPTMCNMVLHGLTETLKGMPWTPGDQFDVVTVSFNPLETPALASERKKMYLNMLGKPEAAEGWHFLTGEDTSIAALTEAVGFRYNWIEDEQVYAHPFTLIFLSGEGTVMRYMPGIQFAPSDVRAALIEVSEGRAGSPLNRVLLYCLQYDPNANSYVLHAVNLMKFSGGLAVVLLGVFFVAIRRRGAHRTWSAPGHTPAPTV